MGDTFTEKTIEISKRLNIAYETVLAVFNEYEKISTQWAEEKIERNKQAL